MNIRLVSLVTFFLCFSFSCMAQENKGNRTLPGCADLNDSTFIIELANLKLLIEKENEIGAMKYFVKQIPSKENPLYVIQTLRENEYRFEVIYSFYCYPQTGEIKLYNALGDSLIKIK